MNYEKAYKDQIEKYKALQNMYRDVCQSRDTYAIKLKSLEERYNAERKETGKYIDRLQFLIKELENYKKQYDKINKDYALLLNHVIGAVDNIGL
jgi:chromosome segregation ATPase